MATGGGGCAFCGATAPLVPIGVLDEKWCWRFGGEPVMALDHGWCTTVHGERKSADVLDPSKFFGAHVRALCDYCVHGWVEDVRWRAEPALLSVAEGHLEQPLVTQASVLRRWAQLTAMLAELVEGMPRAASFGQRDAVRRGTAATPPIPTWIFRMRQRLPARVHLSQVSVRDGSDEDEAGLVQVVSVDLAHLSVLVVMPSNATALEVVERSAVTGAVGLGVAGVVDADASTQPLNLSTTPHPHHIALQRLCSASAAVRGAQGHL